MLYSVTDNDNYTYDFLFLNGEDYVKVIIVNDKKQIIHIDNVMIHDSIIKWNTYHLRIHDPIIPEFVRKQAEKAFALNIFW